MNHHNFLYLKIIVLLTGIIISGCNDPIQRTKTPDDILWYHKPAENWEEALPLGNGRLGVMVFGKTSNERIQLNDDSLWPGDPGWDDPEGNKNDLDKIRKLLFEGKNAEADQMFIDKFSRKRVVRSHQTLGDLFLDFSHENITNYRRELNVNNAVVTTTYQSDGNNITEKVFVSHPHQAIIIELTSQSEQGLNGKIRLSRPEDQGHPTIEVFTTEEDILVMKGEVTQRGGYFNDEPDPISEGVKFETCLKVRNNSGQIHRGQDFLEMMHVKKATLIIVSNSSFYHEDFSSQNRKDIEFIGNTSINTLQKIHNEDFNNFYKKCRLDLQSSDLDSIPTDQRIVNVKSGAQDLGLEALLFNYGRYLLISCSRPGTNPANLQGLWNQHIEAPWNADYHLNINLQMNYWLADVTNLGELNYPLFNYIDRLVKSGKTTAHKNFGCRGTFIPHATDLWAPTWLRAPTAYWGCSVGAGGWLAQHLWQHYTFTNDTIFLRDRVLPVIQEIAQFYSDWIIEDPRDGTLVSAPSTSPENRFFNSSGEVVATCRGSAIDQQIIDEVFENYIATCNILGVSNNLLDSISKQKEKLRNGFVIGSDGRILEWDREYAEHEPGHRHMSHLYGFHPGTSVTKDGTPEIFEAVRKTLDFRLENGGAGTGWSRAWLINCSARLLDGDMAHDHIRLLFQKSIYPNLFDAHPPFQIDGNFGYTAGIAEMLLQSHEKNMLRILPALPGLWDSGSVIGLKARGGLTVDIFWNNNKLERVIINSQYNSNFNMVYRDKVIPVKLNGGESFVYYYQD